MVSFLGSDKIKGGIGIIENDFYKRKDLTPDVCVVYKEKHYRYKGIIGHPLNKVVEDIKTKEITPIYLVSDHILNRIETF